MTTTVIIPARNEAATIGDIVGTFNLHPETSGQVYVGIDRDSTDETSRIVWENHGCAFHTDSHGKGQVVWDTFKLLHETTTISDRIILCDGDYTGLTAGHIDRILHGNPSGMTIGVPDFPQIDVPERVIMAWPRTSGFRCVPWTIIPENAHGYLLETQLNLAAIRVRMHIQFRMMPGLRSPFQWPLTSRRRQALERDREWGERNSVL